MMVRFISAHAGTICIAMIVGSLSLAVTLIALELVGEGDGASGQPDVTYTGDFLMIASRELEICVDTINVDSLDAASAESVIGQAWPIVEQHPVWISEHDAAYGAPSVAVGCPGVPALDNFWTDVEIPSPYRVHIFIVGEEAISSPRLRSGRTLAEEMLFADDSGVEITTGLYLTSLEFQSPEILAAHLVKAFGFEASGPVRIDPAPTAPSPPAEEPTPTTPPPGTTIGGQ